MYAYKLVTARSAQDGLPDGNAMLAYLRKVKILHDDSPLKPYSGFPDMSLERQFAQDRQMYHFMIPNDVVLRAARPKNLTYAQRQRVTLRYGLRDCVKMIYFFLIEMLGAPERASRAGRGIYVLMHAVTDSYSPEHTTRTQDNFQLKAIKGWKLSRFGWPDAAKEKQKARDGSDDHTLLLLHQSIHAAGDYNWKMADGKLSPQAEQAARAVADLLVLTYQAHRHFREADKLWEAYASRWFVPEGASIKGPTFYFPGTTDSIRFDYAKEYHKYRDAYGFDVFPQWTLSVFGQGNINNLSDMGAYGVELNWHWIPGFADKAGVFLNRLPYGAALSVTRMPRLDAEVINRPIWQFQALFAPNLVIIPKINAYLQPRLGFGLTSFAPNIKPSLVAGADLAWNLARPKALPIRQRLVSRFGVGYEFDAVGLPARHSIGIKIGLNYMRGRRLYRPQIVLDPAKI